MSERDVECVEEWVRTFHEYEPDVTIRDGSFVKINVSMPDAPDDPLQFSLRDFYVQKYETATPLLNQLITNNDPVAKRRLDRINAEIVQKNKDSSTTENRIPDETGTIQMSTIYHQSWLLLSIIRKAKLEPLNRDIKTIYQRGATMLADFVRRQGYPQSWAMDIPEEVSQAWESLDAHPQSSAVDTTGQPQSTPQPQPATAPGEAASSTFNPATPVRPDFPWACGKTATGDRIIACWKWAAAKGTNAFASSVVVETVKGNRLVYLIESGGDCGLFEVAQYLAMPGIYQINVPADKRKRWTYKERLDFVELVFVASARYKTHHVESNLRSPKSLCAVRMKDGLELMIASDFIRMLGEMSAKVKIAKYCKEAGTTPPWNIKPELVMSGQKKKKLKETLAQISGRLADTHPTGTPNPGTTPHPSRHTGVNPTQATGNNSTSTTLPTGTVAASYEPSTTSPARTTAPTAAPAAANPPLTTDPSSTAPPTVTSTLDIAQLDARMQMMENSVKKMETNFSQLIAQLTSVLSLGEEE